MNAFLHTTVRVLEARLVAVSAEAWPTNEEDQLWYGPVYGDVHQLILPARSNFVSFSTSQRRGWSTEAYMIGCSIIWWKKRLTDPTRVEKYALLWSQSTGTVQIMTIAGMVVSHCSILITFSLFDCSRKAFAFALLSTWRPVMQEIFTTNNSACKMMHT
jgi:hypothetical protein